MNKPLLFLDRLRQNCQQFPDKIALEFIHDEGSWFVSYADLLQRIEITARHLVLLGVQPGDRVAIQLPKCLEFIYFHLAAMRIGAVSLPLNPDFPAPELKYFLQDSGAKALFADSDRLGEIEEILPELPDLTSPVVLPPNAPELFGALLEPSLRAEVDMPPWPSDPEQTALMIYTSGTTGRPKGAELTHANLTANLNALHQAWQWQSDDLLLHVLPIFHTHGLTVALHGALNAGASVILLPKFDAHKTLSLLEARECSVFMAVPTIHSRLLAVPGANSYDLSGMRLITSGSARLADDVFQAFQDTFGYTLLERYGMSETGMNLSNPYDGERRVGSVGLPLPDVEARIVDPATENPLPDGEVGEVQIRGPHVFKGYWRQPEKTAAAFSKDGWLRTGDQGLREPDGYFTLKGRSKDLIISGGYNVYPPEVELVLAGHPAVEASAVIGCPDEQWGERVVAVIVLKDGQEISEEAIINYCRSQLAPYKSPKNVVFLKELPRNAMGKVQKALLRQDHCG